MALELPPWTPAETADEPTLERILAKLANWGEAREWIAPDPYEGMNTAAAGLLRRSTLGRQVVIQAYRRSPLALPWPLRAPARANAKALGLVLSGYALPAGQALPQADAWVPRLADELESMRLPESGAWGYHFDVQTRHLYYDSRTANAVATCFVIRGLLDAHDHGLLPDGADAARRAGPFLESLWREHPQFGPYFSYVAGGSELIHNANLMVCGTLARLLASDPRPDLERRIADAAETTARLRRDDGLWPYGERDDLTWRDNFHTAYILEGLARIHSCWGGYESVLAEATSKWLAAFFDETGAATYRPRRRYPVDAHSAASAIDSLCVLTELGGEWASLANSAHGVAIRSVEVLWLEDKCRFAAQRNAHFLNPREFMRWTNAPMFEALSRLLSRNPALH